MTFAKGSKAVLAITLGVGFLSAGGCDLSKDELAQVRTERDQLKVQITTMQSAAEGMKKELTDAKAQAAKCQSAAAPATSSAPTAALGKAGQPAAPAAPPDSTAAPGKAAKAPSSKAATKH